MNIGSDDLLSIDGLVGLIKGVAGVEFERTYDNSKPKGVMERCSDNEKIEAELGWSPSTRLQEGMAETNLWIEEQACRDLA